MLEGCALRVYASVAMDIPTVATIVFREFQVLFQTILPPTGFASLLTSNSIIYLFTQLITLYNV